MLEFLKKFFGYFYNENSGKPEPYQSGNGKGYSDIRYYIWIILIIVLAIYLYKYFKIREKKGRKFLIITSSILFIVRFSNQLTRAIIGAEVPAFRAFPFHLCTVMTFLLPIVIIFNLKKLKNAVYPLSIMGGIITVFINGYFDNSFLTFSSIEGMTAHSLLIILPIVDMAVSHFSLNIKKIYEPIILIFILMGWATLGNEVFFKGYDTNYMYLKKNELPNDFGGKYYFLIYVTIFFILLSLVYFIPYFYRKKKNKFKNSYHIIDLLYDSNIDIDLAFAKLKQTDNLEFKRKNKKNIITYKNKNLKFEFIIINNKLVDEISNELYKINSDIDNILDNHNVCLLIKVMYNDNTKEALDTLTLLNIFLFEQESFLLIYTPYKILTSKNLENIKILEPTEISLQLYFAYIYDEDEDASFIKGFELINKPNLVIRNSKKDQNEVTNFLYDIAYYIYSNEVTLKDKDTIGPDDNTKYLIEYEYDELNNLVNIKINY